MPPCPSNLLGHQSPHQNTVKCLYIIVPGATHWPPQMVHSTTLLPLCWLRKWKPPETYPGRLYIHSLNKYLSEPTMSLHCEDVRDTRVKVKQPPFKNLSPRLNYPLSKNYRNNCTPWQGLRRIQGFRAWIIFLKKLYVLQQAQQPSGG